MVLGWLGLIISNLWSTYSNAHHTVSYTPLLNKMKCINYFLICITSFFLPHEFKSSISSYP